MLENVLTLDTLHSSHVVTNYKKKTTCFIPNYVCRDWDLNIQRVANVLIDCVSGEPLINA